MQATARDWALEQGRAAFLFAYEVDRGQQEDFIAAYQEHLRWHVEHRDHLAWYGWFVTNGPRVGAFVDGTFGITLADYDLRPDLAEDGRHFAEVVAPFVRPTRYSQLALWPEVSTVFALEQWRPSRLMDVWTIGLEPSAQRQFEAALTRAAKEARRTNGRLEWTWYRGVSGYERPTFLVIAPRDSHAGATGDRSSLPKLAALAYGVEADDLNHLADGVISFESEVWAYRPDLSLFPDGQH
jgi:hypothetical protein